MMKTHFLVLSMILCSLSAFAQIRKPKGNQRAFYECKNPIDIDSNLVTLKPGKLFFQFNTDQRPTEFELTNFYWTEYNPEKYFTAYLVNNTDSTFSLRKQDGSLIMIQEALNETGEWQPIEFWVYSGCGNSYSNQSKLEPGKCLFIPIKKYSGKFTTQIRLKLKNRKNIYYSDSFEGSINKSQFKKERKMVNGILYRGPANYLDNK